jgi:hypothetical protein
MPAFPAFVLLAASVVLLFPRARALPSGGTFQLTGRRLTVAFAVAVAVFVVAPLAVVAATPALHDRGRDAVRLSDNLVPVSSAVAPNAALEGGAVRVSWRPRRSGPTDVFYRVLRAPNDGVTCGGRRNAADDCRLYMDTVATVSGTSYVDRPGPGIWSYRIGVSANWLDDFRYGDVYVVSRPVSVNVP